MKQRGFKSFIAIMMAVILTFGTIPFAAFADTVENISTSEEYENELDGENEITDGDSEENEEFESESDEESEENEDKESEESELDDEESDEDSEEKLDKENPKLPLGGSFQQVQGEVDTIEVIIDFEGYNLGQGFYIEPMVLEIPKGSSSAFATDMALTKAGFTYTASTSGGGFFLDRIQGFDNGNVVLPDYLEEIIEEYWGWLDPGSGDGSLGSNDYVDGMSGWMNTVNHVLAEVGAASHILEDGDVIRWQFSIWGFGRDLGIDSDWGGPALYGHLDKTELIRALVADGVSAEAKQLALDTVIKALATEADIEAAIEAINGGGNIEEPEEPEQPAGPPALSALIVNRVAVESFDGEVTEYTISVKGVTSSEIVATFDDSKYTLIYDNIARSSGDTIFVSTAANSGANIAELVVSDIDNPSVKTVYTLQLVNPRSITLSSAFKALPAGAAAMAGVLINGKAEATLFQADADGVANTSSTYSATVNNYRSHFLSDIDAVDIMIGNISVAGHIRVIADGVEVAAPMPAAKDMVLADLPVNTGITKIIIELCTDATYTANNGNFVAENSYNIFVDKLDLQEEELAKAKIEVMEIEGNGEFATPFTPEAYRDTIWVKGAEGSSVTYKFSVASGTGVYKHLTSITAANTLSSADGIYSLAAKITEPFTPVLLVGYQTIIATSVVIDGYTIRYQYKILYDTSDSSGVGGEFSVIDYIVPASQYTNKPTYGMIPEAVERGSVKSLGNFGGYITLYFENPIQNDPKNASGVDLTILGNSFGTGGEEPGNVWVSEDNIDWYLLAGSDYFDDNTLRDYQVTYTRGFGGASSYSDNYGSRFPISPAPTASSSMYNYPLKANYPLYNWKAGEESSMTFTGPLLLSDGADPYASVYAASPQWGYVDVNGGSGNPYSGRTGSFDIAWAVDEETGRPVELSQIHYVKVATASHIYAGSIGEKSTEVAGLTREISGAYEVGKTKAPDTIKINASAITLADGIYEYTADFGETSLEVEVEGIGSSTVFINNAKAASRTYADIPKSETVRIVIQDGSKEPIIYYITKAVEVDKTALNNAIIAAQAIVQTDYTAESIVVLQAALNEAVSVAADDIAKQAQVDKVAQRLQKAIDDLVLEFSKEGTIQNLLSNISRDLKNSAEDWAVMAMAAYGMGQFMDKDTLVSNSMAIYNAANRPATDFERAIISMTAMGIDASNVNDGNGGYANFIEKLANFNSTNGAPSLGTVNNYIYSLIALDSGKYELPSNYYWSRGRIIEHLLKAQEADGSWALQTGGAVDITAMAISALLNYTGDPLVNDAVNKAIGYLSLAQTSNGGFSVGSTENTNSTAMVIVALAGLGVDVDTDPRFIKNGNSPIDALIALRADNEDGFRYGASSVNKDYMATEQGFRALVAYTKWLDKGTAYNIYAFPATQGNNPPSGSVVDKSGLDAKIQEAWALNPNHYTAESWAKLAKALFDAQNVFDDANATHLQVHTAQSALDTAIRSLKNINNSNLKITVTFALYGAEAHSDKAKYIYNKNAGIFQNWIPAHNIDMTEGDNMLDVFDKALNQNGISYSEKGYNYIDSVRSPLSGEWLSEFTNGEYSGWMYMVNGKHPGVGLRDFQINDGDVIIWHYSDDYRLEEGSANWGGAGIGSGNSNSVTEIIAFLDLDGSASASLAGAALDNLVNYLNGLSDKNGAKATISIDISGEAKCLEFTLPNEVLDAFKGKTETSLEIESPIANLTLDARAVNEISKIALSESPKIVIEKLEDAALSEESKLNIGGRNIYSVSIWVGDTKIDSLSEGSLTIFLPYTPNQDENIGDLYVYMLDESGELLIISDFSYDNEKKGFIFTTDTLGVFAIGNFIINEEDLPLGSPQFDSIRVFVDVPENHPAREYIEFMAEKGFIHGVGDGLFAPERNITRAEFVALLFNMSVSELPSGMTKFSDVSATAWYAPFVSWAVDNGITYGTSENAFSPNEMITFQDMALMTWRYIELMGLNTAAPAYDYAELAVSDETAPYARDAMANLLQSGAFANIDNGELSPASNITRAQSAIILATIIMNNN